MRMRHWDIIGKYSKGLKWAIEKKQEESETGEKGAGK